MTTNKYDVALEAQKTKAQIWEAALKEGRRVGVYLACMVVALVQGWEAPMQTLLKLLE